MKIDSSMLPFLWPPASFLGTTMAILIAYGSVTAALILYKSWQYRTIRRQNASFLKKFRDSPDPTTALLGSETCHGPLGQVVKASLHAVSVDQTNRNCLDGQGQPYELLRRVSKRRVRLEADKMERGVTLLGVIGATAPLLGLFGTVWEVMQIFEDIGRNGPASLVDFAAPIRDALFATAAGVALAVPAILAYHLFCGRCKAELAILDDFADDLIPLIRQTDLATLSSNVAEPAALARPPETRTDTAAKHSYGQILKSSALIGGSSVINIAIGIVRTKAVAVLLGPAGFGLMGLYGSISDLAQNIATMGINSSGVRQIADAVGSGESERIARTTLVLRRTSVVLGLLGGSLLIVFSAQASTLTFGDPKYSNAVALLSLAVFFRCLSAGQGALIQGMRRISDLAKMGILGTIAGTLITIPLVYFFREQGVVPSLIGIAATGVLTSWWYSRKIKVQRLSMPFAEIRSEASALLKLGFAFMASGIMMMGATYAIRVLIVRNLGLEAAGLYQSAWALGGLYVGFILESMGADFYPRLTAVAKNDVECNRLVNEQTQVSLLLAGPGVIATIAVAPLVIALFYSAKFHAAVEVLRWLCFGMALRIISWPMGFIILAKGAQQFFFWSEAAWTLVYLGLAWGSIQAFGLTGAGMAFFGSYVFHVLMIAVIVRRLSGFRWYTETKRLVLVFLALISAVFGALYALPPSSGMVLGTFVAILSGVYSFRLLLGRVPHHRIPQRLLKLLVWIRLAPSGAMQT